MPATILHPATHSTTKTPQNATTKKHFRPFCLGNIFRNLLENLPFCQMQVECHTPVCTPFPLRHCASRTRRLAQRGASHTMYNQCFSCQHNEKGPYLNCIIKLNIATLCILKLSPKFWQSDSQIKRCNLSMKHKFLVWESFRSDCMLCLVKQWCWRNVTWLFHIYFIIKQTKMVLAKTVWNCENLFMKF